MGPDGSDPRHDPDGFCPLALKPEVLQRLMRHKSYQTTQKSYINPTSQLEDAIADMPVPNVRRKELPKPDEPPVS
ncbi:hypothetical protein PX52LOC_06628 [Limnoglobus roseus]|uniref:Uncharacterized protein n=1 Tax=Limnoglobus roseus TaxID=2598579 RepID=A0A5C1AP78_9BACT|nr:hypothetical protein PX52LOC_06628 [Limnoglobus roseus]